MAAPPERSVHVDSVLPDRQRFDDFVEQDRDVP
jgi:hypothetical protein